MENTFNLLKNARLEIARKMSEQEDRIRGGISKILETAIADDTSDFSNAEKDAYMIWNVYGNVILAIADAEKKLKQAIETEKKSNIACE